jgi:hypothetical protein
MRRACCRKKFSADTHAPASRPPAILTAHATTRPEWSMLTQRGVGSPVAGSLNPSSLSFARGVSTFDEGLTGSVVLLSRNMGARPLA